MSNRAQRVARSLARAGLAGLLITLPACTSMAPAPAGVSSAGMPAPFTGPGRPAVEAKALKHLEKGWRGILRSRPNLAAAEARRAGAGAAARVLAAEARLGDDPAAAEKTLKAVVAANPGYAAAWIALSVAAEAAGDEATALAAARRGAALWPSERWRRRAARLKDRWVTARLERARRALAAGEAESAEKLARGALAVDPGSTPARLLEAEALLAAGKPADADRALDRLGDLPAAVALRGRIAEREERWDRAMALYRSLPPAYPGRAALIDRATTRWRIDNLPPYVGEAIHSTELTRAQMAVLLVDLAPQVEALASGPVPLLSDAVGLPEQREILTAVRAGLLDADALEHRFFPAKPVTPAAARTAIDRLFRLLGRKPPGWCRPPQPAPGCRRLEAPVTGRAVAAVILPALELEDAP